MIIKYSKKIKKDSNNYIKKKPLTFSIATSARQGTTVQLRTHKTEVWPFVTRAASALADSRPAPNAWRVPLAPTPTLPMWSIVNLELTLTLVNLSVLRQFYDATIVLFINSVFYLTRI